MRAAIAAIVLVLALAEAIVLAVFVVASFSSDPLGSRIARGMVTLLVMPFALFTVPAIVLAWSGRFPLATLSIALMSVLAMGLMWLWA